MALAFMLALSSPNVSIIAGVRSITGNISLM
jgi:hypothetical protein